MQIEIKMVNKVRQRRSEPLASLIKAKQMRMLLSNSLRRKPTVPAIQKHRQRCKRIEMAQRPKS